MSSQASAGVMVAPAAPGALGRAIDPTVLLRYLEALRHWQASLRTSLDDVDRYSRTAVHQDALLGDITLAMAVMQAIDAQIAKIIEKWDSGRVLAQQTTEISTLLWGRLDDNLNATLAVSFVEACALGTTLVRSLRDRLDEAGALLGGRLAQLVSRADAIELLAARCREKIANAPTIAVPNPNVVGDVPTDPTVATQFSARLDEIDAALTAVEQQFRAPLQERDELRSVMGAYLEMAAVRGCAESNDVVAAEQAARMTLWSAPCDLAVGREQVAELQRAVHASAPRPGVMNAPRGASSR